jgi:hypothetical protein
LSQTFQIFHDPELVLSTVQNVISEEGLGLKLIVDLARNIGLTDIEVDNLSRVMDTNQERLRFVFETKARTIGRDEAGRQLLSTLYTTSTTHYSRKDTAVDIKLSCK